MKNWKIVATLILFFPLGVYFMFKHTNWSERTKWIISIIGSFIFGTAFISDFFYDFVFASGILISLASIIWFIYALIRRKQKRSAIIALLFGVLISVYSINTISDQTAEAERIAIEVQVEEARVAEAERIEEERLAEEQKIKEQEALKELEEKYLGIASEAVEKVEQEPTYTNYNKAVDLIEDLSTVDDELNKRLNEVESVVEEYEKALIQAEEAVDMAEKLKDRDSYDKAYALSSALVVRNNSLTSRLTSIDEELTATEEKQAEEERLVQEKKEKEEAERIAEEKAEAERIAAEKAEAEKAAADKQAAEAAANAKSNQSSGSDSSGSSSSSSVVPPSVSSPTLYVDQNGDGTIKGSVNQIYHLPGSTYYSRTKNVAQWFKTVEDAEAAGYRAPER